jgi:hypothetical protein
VADPATTRGLFESAEQIVPGESDVPPVEKPRALTLEDFKRDYPELVEQLCRESLDAKQRLEAEVERLTVLEAAHQKRDTMRRLLSEFNFPNPDSNDPKDKTILSEQFMALLLEVENEETIRHLIEERARLVKASAFCMNSTKPCSRDQNVARGIAELDAKSFVEAIT